jgi:hypothetical protein
MPHASPDGRLINLYGRAAGAVKPGLRHDHLPGPKALFHGPATRASGAPLAICEAALDAASIIQAGHGRTIALFGKNASAVPWTELGRSDELVICFDADEEGQKAADRLVEEAILRGRRARRLPLAAYGSCTDASAALEEGELDIGVLRPDSSRGSRRGDARRSTSHR